MKRALVTAGSSGLGRSIVQFLSDAGYQVIAQAHANAALLQSIDRVSVCVADLSSDDGRRTLVDAVRSGGALDVLVHNLGIYVEDFVEDIDVVTFRSVFELTCTANFALTQDLMPELVAAAPARVITIGDSGADRIEARTQATPYHIAKVGCHILTRTFAQRYTDRGVTFNMVSPGFLENSVGVPGEPVPAGRLGAFTDIVGAVEYLLSGRAAYVSGANIVVSGGWNG